MRTLEYLSNSSLKALSRPRAALSTHIFVTVQSLGLGQGEGRKIENRVKV